MTLLERISGWLREASAECEDKTGKTDVMLGCDSGRKLAHAACLTALEEAIKAMEAEIKQSPYLCIRLGTLLQVVHDIFGEVKEK